MTYLQLVNAVLRRLREDEVSSVTQSDYARLIGQFVNEAKEEVENAWNWVQLRSTIQVNTVDGTFRYTLTGAGDRFRILQVINDTENQEMRPGGYKWMNRQFTMSGAGVQKDSPHYWDINGSTDGDPNVDVYPIPDAVYSLNFNLVLPQADLSDEADVLLCPSMPVILGAYMRALSERGEDGGNQFGEALRNYTTSVSDAVAIDSLNYENELVWETK